MPLTVAAKKYFFYQGLPPPDPPGSQGPYITHILDITWTVRSISTYQRIWIVRSIYGSTFEKIVENRKILNLIKNQTFSNCYIYKSHASKIQNVAKTRIYRKSCKKKFLGGLEDLYVDHTIPNFWYVNLYGL